MGIRRIDYEVCIGDGCALCVDGCPTDVLRTERETLKPRIQYLRDCMNCFYCESICPTGAIYVTPFRERRVPSSSGTR